MVRTIALRLALKTSTASVSLVLLGSPLRVVTAIRIDMPHSLGSRVRRSTCSSGGGGAPPQSPSASVPATLGMPAHAAGFLHGGVPAGELSAAASAVMAAAQRFQELLPPWNAATVRAAVLASSPPSRRFFLQGWRPAAMRRSASLPA